MFLGFLPLPKSNYIYQAGTSVSLVVVFLSSGDELHSLLVLCSFVGLWLLSDLSVNDLLYGSSSSFFLFLFFFGLLFYEALLIYLHSGLKRCLRSCQVI